MVILQRVQILSRCIFCATCGTNTPFIALEASRNFERVYYFQGKNRLIGEFETFCGRPRARQCLCEPTVCTVNGFQSDICPLHLFRVKALIQDIQILFCHFVYGHAGFLEYAIFVETWFKGRAVVEANSIDELC